MQLPPVTSEHMCLLADIRAILFDLDDTLYDRGGTFYRWAEAFVKSHLPAGEHEAALALLCALDAQGRMPRPALFSAFQQVYPGLYEVETMIETYYEQFPAYIHHVHLTTLLATIVRLNIPIGIVTNGFIRQQQPKIAVLGLDAVTECMVISEHVGVEKPAPSLFLTAAEQLNVPVGQILFIGDNPSVDIYGAHQVGMKTMWVQHDATWPADLPYCADLRIRDIIELAVLLSWYHTPRGAGNQPVLEKRHEQ